MEGATARDSGIPRQLGEEKSWHDAVGNTNSRCLLQRVGELREASPGSSVQNDFQAKQTKVVIADRHRGCWWCRFALADRVLILDLDLDLGRGRGLGRDLVAQTSWSWRITKD